MKRFIEGEDRSQVTLMPECLDNYIAEDNPVRVVDAYVEVHLRQHERVTSADRLLQERVRRLLLQPEKVTHFITANTGPNSPTKVNGDSAPA